MGGADVGTRRHGRNVRGLNDEARQRPPRPEGEIHVTTGRGDWICCMTALIDDDRPPGVSITRTMMAAPSSSAISMDSLMCSS